MVYTEIKEKNGNKYYYSVRSIREGRKLKKKRIYLGVNLTEEELKKKKKEAEVKLMKDKINKALIKIIPEIIRILKKNHVRRAGIFGSYARGEQRKNSDIDILIEPVFGMGFKFAGIEIELEEKLGRKVDLVNYKYLSPHMKKEVLKEEIRII